MRGIGAIIHFHSPPGSSALSPDFSGMWDSIRDWFSLPAQDEAALCFRVFYQPDEATSALDRLKSFLRLKALASPGRQDNFTVERMHGTGEAICMIASGKNSDFPSVTLFLSDQEWHTAQPQGETADNTLSLERAGNRAATTAASERSASTASKGTSITDTQIQTWRDLSLKAKYKAGGWRAWVQAQGIATGSARNFLTNTGLTLRGAERLQPSGEKGRSITNRQLREWFSMSPAAHREAGSWIKWAQAQGISISSARNYLTNTGLSLRGMERLQSPGEKHTTITDRQIQAWRDLTPEAKREAGGCIKWAQAQRISIKSIRNYLTNTGLTPCGVERLLPHEKKATPITTTQIQTWLTMSPAAHKAAGGWKAWALAQGITISSARNCLTNTGLNPVGIERLQPPGERGVPITRAQIQAWRDLSQEARNEAGGWIKWVQAQGIIIGSAINYLSNSGLTIRGVERLLPHEKKGIPITTTQIQTWLNMSPTAHKEAGGWKAWALAQGISTGSARNCLTNTGLTPFGIARLQSPDERGSPITRAQIQAWRDLSPAARREAGGWIKWAQAQGITISSAINYLSNSGLTVRGEERLLSPSATVTSGSQQASTSAGGENSPPQSSGAKRAYPLAGEELAAPLAKQIKEEDDAVTWRTHQIDNNLPILQHWRDPTVSVLAQAEGQKETLHVTFWGPLFNQLPRETKARINQDIRWFLRHEGNHDAHMNAMMSVAIPLDDRDGYRGRTVYARTDLAAYTVLGPYSGRLLENETVRCEYEKEYGKEAGNYYFATRSQERIVSAWPQGNFLSLINNPVFTSRTAEAEDRQNVSAVLVGKNITFFLTTRAISAGEELWFDYGTDYRHFEPGEGLRSVQVKEEPPASQEG